MRIFLIIPFMLPLTVWAQSKTQSLLEKEFVKEYCSCLTRFSNDEPGKILYGATEACIRAFFNEKAKAEDFEMIAKEREMDSHLSDYDKGKIIGREIMFNTIEALIRECLIYRYSLKEYKTILIKQASITSQSVDSTILEFRDKEKLITDEKSKATYFTLLGVMYEFAGDKKEALSCYEKSMNYYPTTQAKGLRLLLMME